MLKNAIQSAGLFLIHVNAKPTHDIFLKKWFALSAGFSGASAMAVFSARLPSSGYSSYLAVTIMHKKGTTKQ
jgi:hypothetical protein